MTVGALAIGMVALKTLREIKTEAASEAKDAAAVKISETMAAELEPSVNANVRHALPAALKVALLNDELGHETLSEMAQRGEPDAALVAELAAEGANDYPVVSEFGWLSAPLLVAALASGYANSYPGQTEVP